MPLRSLSQRYASFHLPSFTIKSLSLSLPRLRFSYILHNIYIASIHNQKHIFLNGFLTCLPSCYSNHTVATPLFYVFILKQVHYSENTPSKLNVVFSNRVGYICFRSSPSSAKTLHTPACKNIKGAYFIVPGPLLHLKHLSSGASTWEVWTNWQQ